MNSILLVEDEVNVRNSLAEYLRKEGFIVTTADSLGAAEKQLTGATNAVVLDWMLPDGQGIELLRKWRSAQIQVPVILLTARAELIDKVLGLELGANDYLTKPFEPRELVARIRVQLRQRQTPSAVASTEQIITAGELSLNLSRHEASYKNEQIELTKTEFELLKVFLESPNQVFSREELLKRVWGYQNYPTTRTVDTHVMQLRQKTKAELFETVHRIGYRFRPTKK